MQQVAKEWLVLAALGLCYTVPTLALSATGTGPVADRYDRVRLLRWLQAWGTAQPLLLAALLATGHLPLWLLFADTAATAALNAFAAPAQQALLPALVPPAASPTTVSPTATPTAPAPLALDYLTTALDLIEREALLRDRVDWPQARRAALALAGAAQTPTDTYPAIRAVLQQLGDRHSSLLAPETVAGQRGADDGPLPRGERLPGGSGYLALPPLLGSAALADRYIASARAIVTAAEREPTCGWVVDLRRNSGGNMWPMLAAVGPLLGEGEAGAFTFPDGRRLSWTYRDGEAAMDGTVQAGGPALRLGSPPPVAVLIDRYTASSGEAIAIAFRGRPDARSFGEPTSGVPTVNAGLPLRDGAVLNLTVARMTDRTGRAYDDRLAPDEPVEGFSTPAEDPERDTVLRAALAWLQRQPGCAR